MDQVRKLTRQAYPQAPWRNQTQLIGSFLLVVVVTALIAFIYLNTTAQAATLGREIQDMRVRIYYPSDSVVQAQEDDNLAKLLLGESEEPEVLSIEELLISISDLEAQLASLTTLEKIEKRAAELGMQPNDPQNSMYLVVDGYTSRQSARLAPPPRLERVTAPTLPAIYKQSLVDWVKLQIVQTSRMIFDEVQP